MQTLCAGRLAQSLRTSSLRPSIAARRQCAMAAMTHATDLGGFSRWLDTCNQPLEQELVQLAVEGQVLGYLAPPLAARLAAFDCFEVGTQHRALATCHASIGMPRHECMSPFLDLWKLRFKSRNAEDAYLSFMPPVRAHH